MNVTALYACYIGGYCLFTYSAPTLIQKLRIFSVKADGSLQAFIGDDSTNDGSFSIVS